MEPRFFKIPTSVGDVSLRVAQGHFATRNSHTNYFIDVTRQQSCFQEADAVAQQLVQRNLTNHILVDTILCMDGTRVIGTCLAQKLTQGGFRSINAGKEIYVLRENVGTNGKLIFRDNARPMLEGKNILLLLASVTTNMDGVANRSFNVNRAAEFCNGKVIQPGEVFSYIDTIGDPSARNGYKTSTGYQNGQTVPMDGGGVCQVSSSLYYCAVYSNLEIVKRACHAFSTGYIANGLDATIFYPSLDFKFRNNTGFPIKIVAYTEGNAWGKLTVQFYGSNPEGIYVKTERYTLSSTPWTTVYEPDETIERGTTKVDVTPYTGYEVDVYRCVYDANDNLISRTYENHSRYAKRDKKILYNPADEGPWGPAVDPGGQPSEEPIPEPTPDIPASMEPIPTPEPGPSMEPGPSDPWGIPSMDPGPTDPWGIPSLDPSFPPEPTFPAYVDPVPTPENTPEGGDNPVQDPWEG